MVRQRLTPLQQMFQRICQRQPLRMRQTANTGRLYVTANHRCLGVGVRNQRTFAFQRAWEPSTSPITTVLAVHMLLKESEHRKQAGCCRLHVCVEKRITTSPSNSRCEFALKDADSGIAAAASTTNTINVRENGASASQRAGAHKNTVSKAWCGHDQACTGAVERICDRDGTV
jgi:hypothetical protein